MKKAITKDCPSCEDMIINDEGKFECKWGKSKKIKILHQSKKRLSNCNLKNKSNVKNG
jgi:hypothetical protein